MLPSVLSVILFWVTIIAGEELITQGFLGSHFGVPGIGGFYGYVVVGCGTAGLNLAHRLAANTSESVAVIEAGDFCECSNGNFFQCCICNRLRNTQSIGVASICCKTYGELHREAHWCANECWRRYSRLYIHFFD